MSTLFVCTAGLVWTLMREKVEEDERAKPHSELREALRETHRELFSVPFKELVGLAYVGVIGGSSLAVLAVLAFVWSWPDSRSELYAWGSGGVATAVVMTLPAAAVLVHRKIRAWKGALRRAKRIIKQESQQQSPDGGEG